jgi:hypothetical protein
MLAITQTMSSVDAHRSNEAFRTGIERAGIRFVPFTGDAAVHPADFAAEQTRYEPGPAQSATWTRPARWRPSSRS